ELESITALAQFFKAQQLCLRFNHVSPCSLAAQLAAALATGGWTSAAANDGTCPIMPLAGHTCDSYLATLGSSHRANVRRRIRALEQKFDVRFERVTSDAQRRDALDRLIQFHESRFDEGGTAFRTDASRAFHDELTRRALDRGWLRLFVLRV